MKIKDENKVEFWSTSPENPISLRKKMLNPFALMVRRQHLKLFLNLLKPNKKSLVLDVGVTPNETLTASNFFEKRYPFPQNLTAVSVEDCRELFTRKYPQIKFAKVEANTPLPFKDKSFDIVVSWATLEHVGEREKQEFFLKELFRVGRKVFVTTPDKSFFYDPHTGLFFVHWLPHRYFSLICRVFGERFFSSKKNLNLLAKKDLQKILPRQKRAKVIRTKLFGLIPSYLILIKT